MARDCYFPENDKRGNHQREKAYHLKKIKQLTVPPLTEMISLPHV